jgi:thiosulfate/3-mercaptopyruvate sulfurtransferase
MTTSERWTHLIDPHHLMDLQAADIPLMVFDCSFDLANDSAGHAQYLDKHLPGAVYAHLGHDLSAEGEAETASGGRHPLPTRERFAKWLGQMGLTQAMQVVVYDRQGANFCGRLWWMLQWVGHPAAAMLDGGLAAWEAAGGRVRAGPEQARPASNFALRGALRTLVTTADVQSRLGSPTQTLIDARAAPRYRGEVEPLDPVAGHIPGALNRPFADNLGADGRFKPADQLRAEFDQLLGGRAPSTVVHQCGSGVSAIPNLIAMELAGLGPTALYAGSWSEWCRDPNRPAERG